MTMRELDRFKVIQDVADDKRRSHSASRDDIRFSRRTLRDIPVRHLRVFSSNITPISSLPRRMTHQHHVMMYKDD